MNSIRQINIIHHQDFAYKISKQHWQSFLFYSLTRSVTLHRFLYCKFIKRDLIMRSKRLISQNVFFIRASNDAAVHTSIGRSIFFFFLVFLAILSAMPLANFIFADLGGWHGKFDQSEKCVNTVCVKQDGASVNLSKKHGNVIVMRCDGTKTEVIFML